MYGLLLTLLLSQAAAVSVNETSVVMVQVIDSEHLSEHENAGILLGSIRRNGPADATWHAAEPRIRPVLQTELSVSERCLQSNSSVRPKHGL
ncbi:unnamed protein product [Sphagnum balticum]